MPMDLGYKTPDEIRREKLEHLENQSRTAREAMNSFCDEVEKGKKVSLKTYHKFCEILGRKPLLQKMR